MPSRDAALEHCEDRLIAVWGHGLPARALAFADLDIVAGLSPDQVAQVEAIAVPVRFAAGEALAREGEEAPLFFALVAGSASIRLGMRGESGRSVRVSSVGPGMSCGEMALVERGRRSADIIADEDVRAYGFGLAEMDALGRSDPQILIRIIGNITKELAERLRVANNEIRALER
jgi:glutaminase